jgi:hypothetical protein
VANVINHFLHQWFFYICEDDQNRWLISLKERWRCYFLQYRSLLSMLILIMLLYLMKNTSCFALYITSFVLFLFLKWSWERTIWRYLTTYMFIYIINNGLHIEKKELFMSDLSNNDSVFLVHIFFKMQMKREGKMTINVLHPFLAVTSKQIMEL